MKTLFEHADILAWENNGFREIRDGWLGVERDKICYIGQDAPADRETYDRKRDFTNKLLIPGLINAHNHCAMTVLRGVGSDLPLQTWLFDKVFPIEDRLRPADVRAGSELALLEMLASGTTAFADMYYIVDETVAACIESGIRVNVGRPVLAFDPEEPYEKNDRAQDSIRLFKTYHGAAEGRILCDFALHAEYTNNDRIARAYSEDCKKYGARMHIHLSETEKEHAECIGRHGMTPAQWFEAMGTLDSPTIAAHGVYVTEQDMDILAAHGATVAHNPTSNMKLGSGFAPVETMQTRGVNVGLGTDGAASNNNLNMFEELHLAAVIHNGYARNAEGMSADTVLKMATVNGAKALGRDNIGALAVGMKADIVAVDLDRPHLYPNFDARATLCYTAQGSDVVMTMVDGKVLYENGAFLTLDRERILAKAKESIAFLYQ